MSDAFKNAADKFHEHLDACQQCESQPFALCELGHKLLMAVGKALGPEARDLISKARFTRNEDAHAQDV